MTKFRTDKIPQMTHKQKAKKLGLMTPEKRQCITFRFQVETLERLNQIKARALATINPKISRTDIIEALILMATQSTNTDIKRMLLSLSDE